MRSFLSVLCFLCAPPLQCALQGTCLRKEAAPGSLVLSPGSVLELTCGGQVTVDGVKVRNGSNAGKRDDPRSAAQVGKTQVWIKSDKSTGAESPGAGRDDSSDGGLGHWATVTVRPSSAAALKADDADPEEEEWEGEWEVEGGGGSRVTRGLKPGRQWKWTRRTGGKADKDITFTSRAALTLSAVKPADSGTYTCFYRGTEMFSFRVVVAEPPETPGIMCYKRSPSGKIRCESTPQETASVRPSCRLLLSKRPLEPLRSVPCSYSSRTSRCWCTLEHNDDEQRTPHSAFMCVTNVAGNVTSNVFHFTPMSILKPDPPSNVTVRQVKGKETRMRVTWNLPTSWRPHKYFYKLFFELKYRPLTSTIFEQVLTIKDQYSDTITDAMPGVEYLIQLRIREQYDGVWSDWSTPVCARSWTAPAPTATPASDYIDIESSGTDSIATDVAPTLTAVSSEPTDVSTHILWISVLLAVLSVILAVYMFSHRDRLLSKLQSLAFDRWSGELPQPLPSAPPAPEGQALVTLGPRCHNECPEEVEENEERHLNENSKAMHFNNSSYFFLQQ